MAHEQVRSRPEGKVLMPVYFVTGKLGAGKTLATIPIIRDAIADSRRIATNLDLFFDHWPKKQRKDIEAIRLPDKPTSEVLYSIGRGHDLDKPDDSRNGVMVLDEIGTWLNSRTWNDKSRKDFIDWCLHARKLRWDIYFIVQDISIVDRQIKETLCEHLVICKRFDRMRIPFFGFFWKLLTGNNLTFPKMHMAIVKYGDNPLSMTVDSWWYRGNEQNYSLYDTEQCFTDSNDGLSCFLSPWHLVGRYEKKKHWYHDYLLPPLAKLSYFIVMAIMAPFNRNAMALYAFIFIFTLFQLPVI